jgi:hypothetical protein
MAPVHALCTFHTSFVCILKIYLVCTFSCTCKVNFQRIYEERIKCVYNEPTITQIGYTYWVYICHILRVLYLLRVQGLAQKSLTPETPLSHPVKRSNVSLLCLYRLFCIVLCDILHQWKYALLIRLLCGSVARMKLWSGSTSPLC